MKTPPNSTPRMFVLEDGRNVFVTFVLVTSLFVLWGFCNGMIDVMDKHFQTELDLSKAQSAWVQFAHYLGYFFMALPAGWLATKLGYKGGIIAGLLMVGLGGFWFLPATQISDMASAGEVSKSTAFVAFLFGVCVIASGLTFLETIANPYSTVLGAERYAATRINLAQSLNGIGWLTGPIVGSLYFYAKDADGNSLGSQTLYIPYVGIGCLALLMAAMFAFARMPDIKTKDEYHLDDPGDDGDASTSRSIWSHGHFVGAVIAQFFYVAAQAGIFAFFINYMTAEVPPIPASWQERLSSLAARGPGFISTWLEGWFETNSSGVLAFSDKGAANLASLGFVFFLLGRFIGASIMKRRPPHAVLGVWAVLSAAACIVISLKLGWASVVCVFACYFLMSIMFPTIFAMGIAGLGSRAKQASAYIVMAIMGGAVVPKLMGSIADHYDMSRAFLVPLVCFVVVAVYGFLWPKLSNSN
jgi:FHS family L-fucose permease-like MFS transporter